MRATGRLGVWNVLSLIEEARRRQLPYLYLGYYVEGCPSMSYKPLFAPNQLRGEDGVWRKVSGVRDSAETGSR